MRFMIELLNEHREMKLIFEGIHAEKKVRELFDYFSNSDNKEWATEGTVSKIINHTELEVLHLFEFDPDLTEKSKKHG